MVSSTGVTELSTVVMASTGQFSLRLAISLSSSDVTLSLAQISPSAAAFSPNVVTSSSVCRETVGTARSRAVSLHQPGLSRRRRRYVIVLLQSFVCSSCAVMLLILPLSLNFRVCCCCADVILVFLDDVIAFCVSTEFPAATSAKSQNGDFPDFKIS